MLMPSSYYTSSDQPGPFARPVAASSLMRCDVVDRLTCREHVLRYGDPDVDLSSWPFDVLPIPPKHWLWERSFTPSDSGWLRFSPCRLKAAKDAGPESGAAVPCLAPGVGVLP